MKNPICGTPSDLAHAGDDGCSVGQELNVFETGSRLLGFLSVPVADEFLVPCGRHLDIARQFLEVPNESTDDSNDKDCRYQSAHVLVRTNEKVNLDLSG